jgi:hypothetical protein
MKKVIITETQLKKIINELSLSGIVDDFLNDIKETNGSIKYLSKLYPFDDMEGLEEYISELTYKDFDELRSDFKKFKKQKKD